MSTVQCLSCHSIVNSGRFCSNCAAPLILASQPQPQIQCLRCLFIVMPSPYCSNCSAPLPQQSQPYNPDLAKPPDKLPIAVFIWSFVGLIITAIIVAAPSPIAMLIIFSGFAIMALGVLGLIQGKMPYLPIEDKKKMIMVLSSGLFLFIIGAILSPSQQKPADSETSKSSTLSSPASTPNAINEKEGITKPTPSTEERSEAQTQNQQSQKSGARPPIDISYTEAMSYLNNFFNMEKSTPVDGYERSMGQTRDKLALLEIIGDKSNISSASLMIGVPKDKPDSIVQNSAIMLRFLANLVPEWNGASDWATTTMQKLGKSGRDKEEIVKGSKAIRMTVIKELGMISIVVEHKNK